MHLYQALRLSLNPASPDVVSAVGGGGKSSTMFRLAGEIAALGKRAVVAPSTRIAAFQTAWAPAFLEVSGDELPWAALEEQLALHGWCLLGGPIVGDRRLGLEPGQVDRLAARSRELGIAAITIEADGSKMRPLKAPAVHEPVLPDSTTHLTPIAGLDVVGAAIDARMVHRPELVRQVLGLAEDAEARLTPAMLAELLSHPAGGAKGRRASMHFVPILNKADTSLHLAYGRLTASILAQRGMPTLLARAGDVERAPVVERWGPVVIVVLAAGAGLRMGRLKQLETVGGEPMIARTLRAALSSGAGSVVTVVGAEGDRVRAALAPWQHAISIVHNPAWQAGQATSVAAALNALPDTIEAAIFVPVDQPFLDPVLFRHLVRAWQTGSDLAAPEVDGELRGAPALFDRRFWPELLSLEGDIGGRSILVRHRDQVTAVAARASWLLDVDTQDELDAANSAENVTDS